MLEENKRISRSEDGDNKEGVRRKATNLK